LQTFLASEYIDIQRAAVYALAHTNDESAIPHVLTALQRADQTILRHAISACRRLRIQAALPRLIELTHHDNPIIEDVAILALGQFPEEEAIQLLVNLAINTEDWHSQAENALRQIGEPANATLIDRLQKASTTKQKARILRLLDHLRPESDLPEHLASTLEDLVHHTEHEVASAAASFAAHRSLEMFTVPELAELLSHDDFGVWYFAVNALGQRRTDEALSHLVDVYVTRKDPINHHALSSIYNYDMSQAIGLIVEHPEVTDEKILDFSSHLAYRGQTLDDPRILAALLRLLEHGSNHNRIRTIDILGAHFMAETAPVLRALLNDMSDEVRAAAIRALARHGDLDIDTLLDRIQDPSGADFRAAVWELSHYDDPRITPALLAVLQEVEDSTNKWNVVQALGRIQEPAVVPVLAELLYEEDMRPHRLSILQILTEFETDEAQAAVEAWCSGEGSLS
jgi:HEAT repeat protein